MKEKFVTSSLSFIMKYQDCDDLKIKRLKYGLEGIYGVIFKLIIILIIALITSTITETALLIVFYAGIRTFSYGMHAKSSLACWISSILLYNGLPFLISKYNTPVNIDIIVIIITIISIILWAPADTPKRPLIRKSRRIKNKIISIMIVLIYITIYLNSINYIMQNAIIYAMLIQSVIINPLTYKLTKTPFNNYKYYKQNE